MLDTRKKFFTQRMAEHWNRRCRKVVTAPSPTEFKKALNDTPRDMV